LVRTGKKLEEAIGRLDELLVKAQSASVANRSLARYNMEWNNIMDITNLITISRMVANSALYREESRGAHYREDFPATDNENWLVNIYIKKKENFHLELTQKPVVLNRFKRESIKDQFFEKVKRN
jgi:fumarate reductase flavoprotein subunit